jgi:hypothetical protein
MVGTVARLLLTVTFYKPHTASMKLCIRVYKVGVHLLGARVWGRETAIEGAARQRTGRVYHWYAVKEDWSNHRTVRVIFSCVFFGDAWEGPVHLGDNKKLHSHRRCGRERFTK